MVVAPPGRSTADKQTDDARAMADLLSGGGPAQHSRHPTALEPSTAAADPVAAPRSAPAARPPVPDVRASASDPTEGVTLTRSEVDAALADFAKLAVAVHGGFTGAGALIDGVGEGTIFQRVGLQVGDLITSIDGARLRSIDDAANLYARVASAKTITAQIVRNGKPLTLRVAIY